MLSMYRMRSSSIPCSKQRNCMLARYPTVLASRGSNSPRRTRFMHSASMAETSREFVSGMSATAAGRTTSGRLRCRPPARLARTPSPVLSGSWNTQMSLPICASAAHGCPFFFCAVHRLLMVVLTYLGRGIPFVAVWQVMRVVHLHSPLNKKIVEEYPQVANVI